MRSIRDRDTLHSIAKAIICNDQINDNYLKARAQVALGCREHFMVQMAARELLCQLGNRADKHSVAARPVLRRIMED